MSCISLVRNTTFGRFAIGRCRGPRYLTGGLKHDILPTHFTLPSGDKIPSVALGVWKSTPGQVGEAVKTALKAGYRHIDDAWIYGNEVEVGKAIKESGVNRSELFITSKLWNTFHAPQHVEEALDMSLSNLGVAYLDLYLIHWPVAFVRAGNSTENKQHPDGKPVLDLDLTENEWKTWKELEKMVEKGKVRNIGVSNFNIRRFKALSDSGIKIVPAVNQVELSFWNPQPELLQWSKENNVLLEAYSPLGGDGWVGKTLQVPEIKQVADELHIPPAQVIISWAVQRGTVVLPKSVTPSRIVENFQLTKLPQTSFDLIDKAARGHKPIRTVKGAGWGIDVFEDEK